MRILITRPEPEATHLKKILDDAGCDAVVEPLSAVTFDDSEPIETEEVQAVIATSRNGLRALARRSELLDLRSLPLFAVGRATATEARRLRFEHIVVGPGTGSELLTIVAASLDPTAGLILHLSGDVVAVDIAGELEQQGFRVDRHIVYRMVQAQRLSPGVISDLGTGDFDGVILMSSRTADTWVRLVSKAGLRENVRNLVHYCLSDAVAARLKPLQNPPVAVPETPSLEDMLDLIRD
jgi:uroporphyrinogen-III synthase